MKVVIRITICHLDCHPSFIIWIVGSIVIGSVVARPLSLGPSFSSSITTCLTVLQRILSSGNDLSSHHGHPCQSDTEVSLVILHNLPFAQISAFSSASLGGFSALLIKMMKIMYKRRRRSNGRPSVALRWGSNHQEYHPAGLITY